jgi:class 3 adenylate cyclase/tetratricopeptide (TPR) repeat protein
MSDRPAPSTHHDNPTAIGGGSERKPVTALFVDIVGSTTLAESMDPEDWAEIVNGALAVLARPVQRYEGTVAHLLGDGMLVFFGAPIAHEDDPERAVRVALEMVAEIETYAVGLDHRPPIELQIRVGLNTGPVVVGHIGSDQRLEYTAIGDTVNVAARMQSTADPGTVRITAATQRLVAHAFETRDLGPLPVKGKAEPVHAFEVTRARKERRSPRGLPGLESPLVGRVEELGALVQRLEASLAGNGQAIIVSGEPGIGKSRLLREFRERTAEGSGARWVQAQSLSHGRMLPYHLVVRLAQDVAGINPGAEPRLARRALAGLVPDPEAVEDLAHLLSLPMAREDQARIERLDPNVLQERYAASVTTALSRAAERAPLVVVIEDLQWADASSAACLARLMPAAAGLAVLLLITTRVEDQPIGAQVIDAVHGAYGDRVLDLALGGLAPGDSRELVARLLEIESLPSDVREAILGRSDGNPFFVEEVIRMLIDRGVVVRRGGRWMAGPGSQGVEIPATLHGLLLARIDGLPTAARTAIRAAAVIGRTFDARVLGEIVGSSGDGELAVLESAGLVSLERAEPSSDYAFRHALIQEAAYDSILRRERVRLHREVATALERSHSDRPDEIAAEVTRHLEAAGELAAAAEWAFRAGGNAERHSAMPEARDFYDRAATWLPETPETATRRIEIALGQARSGLYFRSFDEEIARLTRAAEQAEGAADQRLLVKVYTALAYALQLRGDQYQSSVELRGAVDRALELGEELGSDPVRGRSMLASGVARLMSGAFVEAADLLGRSVPLLEADDDLLWAFEAQNNLAWALVRLGRLDEAGAAVAHAVALAERSGSPTARVDVKSSIAILDLERERFEPALAMAREAAAEGEEKRILVCAAFGHLIAGEVCLRRGDAASAARSLNRATRLGRLTQANFIENLGRAGLNAARWEEGEEATALAGWAEALELARNTGDRYAEAEVHWRRGAARARADASREEGIGDLETAVRAFESLGAMPATARVLLDLAAADRAAGRPDRGEDAQARGDAMRKRIGLEVVSPPRR